MKVLWFSTSFTHRLLTITLEPHGAVVFDFDRGLTKGGIKWHKIKGR